MRAGSHVVQSRAFRERPAPIGHNGGPPLDVGWNAWNWRRAHAEAWKTPGREIVMLRARRAEALGLSYRAYTSVLMDRGVRLVGIIVMCSDALLMHEEKVAAKLAMLRECSVLLCDGGERFKELSGCLRADRNALSGVVKQSAVAAGTSPGAFFMVGSEDDDRGLAQKLGLGLFVEAAEYFAFPARA